MWVQIPPVALNFMKNEHIVYAYAPLLENKGNLLLVGITDIGWEFLKKEQGNFLKCEPPSKTFSNIYDVWIVRGKDKQEIRDMIKSIAKQKGIEINFAH